MSKLWCWLLCVLLLSGGICEAKEYRPALPGYAWSFPADHASHEAFKTEWWYYTGHLETDTGRRYGYELTFFRVGTGLEGLPDSDWALNNLYVAHFAISDIGNRRFLMAERSGRPGGNLAGAKADVYQVWINDWSVMEENGQHRLRASMSDGAIDLVLAPQKSPVIHGKNGVSQKADCKGCASHYYSLTRLNTTGSLTMYGISLPVNGLSWMDHEFGSNQLTESQVGWDWFSIQLDSGEELMIYQLRRDDGSLDPNSSGTWVAGDGKSVYLANDQIQVKALGEWKSPQSGGVYPMGWEVMVPSRGVNLVVSQDFDAQELNTKATTDVSYWEGSCSVSGTVKNQSVTGQAYVEMTGYEKAFRKRI